MAEVEFKLSVVLPEPAESIEDLQEALENIIRANKCFGNVTENISDCSLKFVGMKY